MKAICILALLSLAVSSPAYTASSKRYLEKSRNTHQRSARSSVSQRFKEINQFSSASKTSQPDSVFASCSKNPGPCLKLAGKVIAVPLLVVAGIMIMKNLSFSNSQPSGVIARNQAEDLSGAQLFEKLQNGKLANLSPEAKRQAKTEIVKYLRGAGIEEEQIQLNLKGLNLQYIEDL